MYRPSPLSTKNIKGVIMFPQGQKGQKVKVMFWVKNVKISRPMSENHDNWLYLKHFLPTIYVSLREIHLKDIYHHIYENRTEKAPKLGGPYLRNRLRYRAIILHVKFFNGMYQHIQKLRKSKMVTWQG